MRYLLLVLLSLTASALTGSNSFAQDTTPVSMRFITGGRTLNANRCSPATTIRRYDKAGKPSTVQSGNQITVSAPNVQFFFDAACTQATGIFYIFPGSSDGVFYFKSTVVGKPYVTLENPTLGTVRQLQSFVPAAASKLQFITQPASLTQGETVSPIQLTVTDAYGNVIRSSTATATASLKTGTGLTGTLTQKFANGLVTFGDLSLSTPVASANLVFKSGSITATSNSFEVKAKPVPTPTPSPTPPVVIPSPTPTPIVVTPSPTPTPIIVVPTPTPTPIVVVPSPTPTPVVVVPSPTPTPVVVVPSPTPTPPPVVVVPRPDLSKITQVWANEGGDKVVKEVTRASTKGAAQVVNRTWDGTKVKVFGAKNEVVSFNLVLEAVGVQAPQVNVQFTTLTGPNGATIASRPENPTDLFNYNGRSIELFYVRYLPIKGLSTMSYYSYDERHVPNRLRRPHDSTYGIGTGTWYDRPEHDLSYPDIAAPLELHPNFTIAAGTSQSIWSDITIPKNAVPGVYTGVVSITESGVLTRNVPVELTVRNFVLPDVSTSKTMLFSGLEDISKRYTGAAWPAPNSDQSRLAKSVMDRHFQMSHRHRISMIDANGGPENWTLDQPRPEWLARLNGTLFTKAKGYSGPGEGIGNDIFSIGTYGSWSWKGGTESDMRTHTDNWESWFSANSPSTERFLYLIDESDNFAQTQQWATWMKNNPGPGRAIASFATVNIVDAVNNIPALSTIASWFTVAPPDKWIAAQAAAKAANKKFYLYNGKRPGNGTFATEDDGVALRELPWGQYKKGIDRWFFWAGTYYNDYMSGRGDINVFQNAQTYGVDQGYDSTYGQTGWNYANGDGLLFYPGTDKIFPAESYNIAGPVASLRLKHWRRGVQDVDYLALAKAKNPALVQQIMNRMVPKVLWDIGISDPGDPTWVRSDISWPTDPDAWEAVRAELAAVIEAP